MDIHANVRTCPNSRRLLVKRVEEENWSLMVAAEDAGSASAAPASGWGDGGARERRGLLDRSSAPKRVPSRLPGDHLEAIEALRRLRMTAAEIAEILGMALSTVSRWLAKRSRLEPPEPPTATSEAPWRADPRRCQGAGANRPQGHRVLGRGRRQSQEKTGPKRLGTTGWEFVHICVDDATRLAYVEVLPTRRATPRQASCAAPLTGSREWGSGSSGCSPTTAPVTAPMFTRRPAPNSKFATSSPPYRPRTNGKAERFIQTLTNRWAYGAIYGSSVERTAALPG